MSNRQCMGCMEFYDAQYQICPHCGYIFGTPAAEAYHLQPGSTLRGGRYLIGRVLGFGGFGVTYLGYDRRMQIKVAVKEYLPSEFSTRMPNQQTVTVYSGDREEQFNAGKIKTIEEAQRLARFRQLPNVVHVFDTFEENNTAYIVMEYCDGESVKSILERQGPLSLEEALTIVLSVAEGLKPVHAEGMIHRDISPDNIYRLKNGTIKILDFGAARYATTKHSKSLSVIIKPGYAPEEQYRSRGDQGPWTDVYALAATFYKMITGITPPDAMERASKDLLVRPSDMGIYMQDGMETALLNALNVAIEDRTKSLDEFEKELLSADVEARKVTDRRTDVGKLSGKAKAGALIGTGAAVLVVAAALLLNPASPVSPFSMPDNMVWVPTLINQDMETARELADSSYLNAQSREMVYSDVIPEGKVVRQSEEGGTRIETDKKSIGRRATIYMDISGGPEITYMPDVRFLSLNAAREKVQQKGLTLVTQEITDMTKAAGTVVTQSTAPDSRLFPGDTVTLTVVKDEGQLPLGDVKNIRIPDVSGLSYEEAAEKLTAAKLAVLRENVKNETIPRDQVITQDPAAGELAAENQMILLTVSEGKELVMVPQISLKTREEAEKLLAEAGLVPDPAPAEVYSSSVPAGKIVEQTPSAQEQAEKGSTVTFVLSKGEDPEVTRQREEENRRRLEEERKQRAQVTQAAPQAAPQTAPPAETPPPVTEVYTTAAETLPPETQPAPETPAAPETDYIPEETAPPETAPPETTAAPETAPAAESPTYIRSSNPNKLVVEYETDASGKKTKKRKTSKVSLSDDGEQEAAAEEEEAEEEEEEED